ncbi:hypothetical protein [Yinghuangia aomiensis]|uniref:hypothetical protein n=1 Tax=Yinghuangia aomiensis TaxID=676205 RepID=UPI0031EF2D22
MTSDAARIALDVLPVRTQQVLDRRVRPQAAAVRKTAVTTALHPFVGDRRGRVLHASVLDGHTFNIQVSLPVPADSGADAAHLFFVGSGSHHRVPLAVRRAGPQELLVEGTVLLGPMPGGTDLTPGRWRLRVLLTSGGRKLNAFDLEGPLDAAEAGGPTQSPTVSVLSGRSHRVRISPLGLLRISVAEPRPHAVVERFELRHSGAHLTFRVVGGGAPPVSVELSHDNTVRHAAVPAGQGDLCTVEIPFDELPRADSEQVWHVHARLRDGTRIVVGRELEVARVPRTVFRMRTVLVATRSGELVRVRPHYSARHQFRLGCTPVASARPGASS